MAALAFAAPPEEKFPEVGKPQLEREQTVLEKAVDRAAAMLLQDKLPPSEDGVRFALWLYGEKGDVAYRDVATRMAREMVRTDSSAAATALFRVAHAGGSTLQEARDLQILFERRSAQITSRASFRVTNGILFSRFAHIAAARDLDVTPRLQLSSDPRQDALFRMRTREGHIGSLNMVERKLCNQSEAAQLFGEDLIEQKCLETANTILDRFWDQESNRFVDPKLSGIDPASRELLLHRDNSRVALAIWEVGLSSGDSVLCDRATKAVESDLEAALQNPKTTGIAGLAAARMSRHPLHIAVVGDPADSLVTALRQAAYFVFEPNRVILNLDPAKDAKQMEALMYPAEAAPALFVCVETLCSPPIRDPAQVEKQVAEIKKLAAEIQH